MDLISFATCLSYTILVTKGCYKLSDNFFESEDLPRAAFPFSPTDLQKTTKQFISSSFRTAVQPDSSTVHGAE